jgi:DNA excision repair protein ERCC-2
MKRVQIAVTDFALPVPRLGSIEVHSGYDLLPQGGDEMHRLAQLKRAQSVPSYKTEVRLSHSFERSDYIFVVSGRIDGLIPGVDGAAASGARSAKKRGKISRTPAHIEEIKTSFDARDLYEKLQANANHPYRLQLETYAYIYSLQNAEKPSISFHIASYSNGLEFDLPLEFDSEKFELWLDKRLDELVREEEVRLEEKARRKALAKALSFPFAQPRPGQIDLVDTIERVLPQGDALMIQAPTGLGKTAGVVFPMLKDALHRGQKLVYVTPKNSQHSVAQDAVKRMQNDGNMVRTLTLTAKSKICLKGEPICNPVHCEFAKDYYAKIYEHDLPRKASDYVNMDAELFKNLGEQYKVCPFELSLDSMPYADVVIGDYNYVFSPFSLVGRFSDFRRDATEGPNLVVDEAHNLPARAVDYYSPSLSTASIRACHERVESLAVDLRMDGSRLLQLCNSLLLKYDPKNLKQVKIKPVIEPFEKLELQLSEFLNRYLQVETQPKPGDPLISFCRQWSQFAQALAGVAAEEEEIDALRKAKRLAEAKSGVAEAQSADADQAAPLPRFFTTASKDAEQTILKITCCDASPEVAASLKNFDHVVAFSATLKPFDYYRQLMGFAENRTEYAEFASPFPKDKRKLMVIPQVSTKFSDREKNYHKIADAIKRIITIRPGNYFIFFPSFAFLRRIHDLVELPGCNVLRQESGMNATDVQRYIDTLRLKERPTIIFAVQGGVFAEGVDYPGDMLIGALIVGPALPGWDLERELLREYYEQKFGNGFDYAYTYPAMARVVQAAGRVIRSQNDSGLIVLMDRRFTMTAYTQTMPKDWFEHSVSELVSNSVVNDISTFWQTTP